MAEGNYASGNTGIALAGICSKLGIKAVLVAPEKVSRETKERMRGLGAEVMETPDDLCPKVGSGTDQAISLAESMAKSKPTLYFMPNQYANEANFRAHYEGTGPEIWRDTKAEVTHFIAGVGTGGTLTGAGEYLKSKKKGVKVIGVQPQANHHIQGLRNLQESAVPALLERRMHVVDEWVTISDGEAFEAVKSLHEKSGMLVGPSSGAVLAAMNNLDLERGHVVLVFADDGRKYESLYSSMNLFDGGGIGNCSHPTR